MSNIGLMKELRLEPSIDERKQEKLLGVEFEKILERIKMEEEKQSLETPIIKNDSPQSKFEEEIKIRDTESKQTLIVKEQRREQETYINNYLKEHNLIEIKGPSFDGTYRYYYFNQTTKKMFGIRGMTPKPEFEEISGKHYTEIIVVNQPKNQEESTSKSNNIN